MKQLLLSFIFLLSFIGVQAQTLVCDPDSIYNEGRVDDTATIFSKFTITNTLNIPLEFTWEFVKDNIPEEWEWQVCDVNGCYNLEAPPPNAQINIIDGSASVSNLGVNLFNHNGVPGHGVTTVRYFSLTDSIRAYGTINVEWNIMGDVATADIVDSYIDVFPNPMDDQFQINTDLEYDAIHLYDLVGRKVKEYQNVHASAYTTSDINRGIYLLAFKKDDEIIHTKRIVKN